MASNNFTKYGQKIDFWYTMELDGANEFKVLECAGESRVGKRGKFEIPSKMYLYDNGIIRFPSLKRMEVHTHSADRTRIVLASMGRIMATIRVSDDDGVSMTSYERNNWPEDVIPNVNRQSDVRADWRSPVALVIQIPDYGKGTVNCDRGTNRYGTNQGTFIIKTNQNREPIIALPGRFDRSQRSDLRRQLSTATTNSQPDVGTTHTHAYLALVERFKRAADRHMYAATTLDRAIAKREMETLRGQMEFEAMAMAIRTEDRFDEDNWMRTYETDAEKVALLKMRRGLAVEREIEALVGPDQGAEMATATVARMETDYDNPIAGPSNPQATKNPTLKGYVIPKKTAGNDSLILAPIQQPNTTQVANASMFTPDHFSELKKEMGEFVKDMMKQFVQQASNTVNVPAAAAPQIKLEPEESTSDCEILDSSMNTMVSGTASVAKNEYADMQTGEIVSSTPEDRSDEQLIIHIDPADIVSPELSDRGMEG